MTRAVPPGAPLLVAVLLLLATLLVQHDAGASGLTGSSFGPGPGGMARGAADDTYLNDDADDTTSGKLTVTKDPASGTCVNAALVVNPATSAADELFFCAADNGTSVFQCDKEGDCTVIGQFKSNGYNPAGSDASQGAIWVSASASAAANEALFGVENSAGTDVFKIDLEGDCTAGTSIVAPTFNNTGGNGYLHNGTSVMFPSGGTLGASPWLIRGYVVASGGVDVAVATDTLNSLAAADIVHSFRNATVEGARVEADGDIQADGNLTIDGTGASTFAGSITIAGGTTIAASLATSGTIDFASVAVQACVTNTQTLTGAATNDPTACSWPAALEAGLSGTCWVSATNTLSYRLCNVTTIAIDPASATFAARIIR